MSNNNPELFGKLDKLQAQIQQAYKLQQAGHVDEAHAAYVDCLQSSADNRLPIFLDQLAQIWLGLGLCEAYKRDWPEALSWYLRAEAAIQSAPYFCPDPHTPLAQANTRKWSPFLPAGLHIAAPQDYVPVERLSQLYGAIIEAYDKSDQISLAHEYHQRALDLLAKYDLPSQEAALWAQRAEGAWRRQQWLELEQAGEKLLSAAGRAGAPAMTLAARRFLMRSQVGQNRYFKAVEHLVVAVHLARELHDDELAADESTLRSLLARLRGRVLELGQAEFLEPLVAAEAVLLDAHLDDDRATLQRWQAERPAAVLPGALPVGPLNSLAAAIMVLENFALRHCGLPHRTRQRPRTGLRALFGGVDTIQSLVWSTKQETMTVIAKDHDGQVTQRKVPSAVLTLFGNPEVIITVAIAEAQCEVTLMDERPITGTRRTGFYKVALQTVPADADALLACLNSFILNGFLVKAGDRLNFVRPPVAGA